MNYLISPYPFDSNADEYFQLIHLTKHGFSRAFASAVHRMDIGQELQGAGTFRTGESRPLGRQEIFRMGEA
jgi:hypothetical protein